MLIFQLWLGTMAYGMSHNNLMVAVAVAMVVAAGAAMLLAAMETLRGTLVAASSCSLFAGFLFLANANIFAAIMLATLSLLLAGEASMLTTVVAFTNRGRILHRILYFVSALPVIGAAIYLVARWSVQKDLKECEST